MAKALGQLRRAEPTARILEAIRALDWTVAGVLSEFIDNSFGDERGNASHVWIYWNRETRVLTILDNGQGIRSVSDLFTLGSGTNTSRGARDIGRYGIGATQGGIWLSSTEVVYTKRNAALGTMRADWDRCIKRMEFPIITDGCQPASVSNCPTALLAIKDGTWIQMTVRRGISVDPEKLQSRLSKTFGPALRAGRRITWTTEDRDKTSTETQLREWSPGKLEDAITTTVTLKNGLSAQVHAGRVDGLSVDNSKVFLNYVYRLVKPTTGGFAVPGFIAFIDLSADWRDRLTATKENIRDEFREDEYALMERVKAAVEPLLAQLEDAKITKTFTRLAINLKALNEGRLTAIVRANAGGGRGKGGTEPRPPGPEPGPRERNVKKPCAAIIEIGQVEEKDLPGRLIEVTVYGDGAMALVNKDHPFVRKALLAGPPNQELLDYLLVAELSRVLCHDPQGLKTFRILPENRINEILENNNKDRSALQPYVARLLTESVVAEPAVA